MVVPEEGNEKKGVVMTDQSAIHGYKNRQVLFLDDRFQS